MRRLVLILCMLAVPVWAVEPDELLDDPVLEERARNLSKELRCVVCRNESIDESNADLAKDMRILVRERIAAGDTDEEAKAFMVDRYGEFVLLTPTVAGANLVLWLAGPAMLLFGGTVALIYLRRRSMPKEEAASLSAEEKARLDALLSEK